MSPIAKLFTVINVVLAGVFLGWAANSLSEADSWRKKHDDLKTKSAAMEATLGTEKSSLLAKQAELEAARVALLGERDSALSDVERLKGQLEDEERKNNEMRGSVTTISASIDNLTAQNKQLAEARDTAQQAAREAEKAKEEATAAQTAAELKASELETSLNTAQGTIADLEKSNTSLKKEVDSLNTNLEALASYTGASIGDFTPMKQIEGRVLDVAMNVKPGLIAINKGSADGVKPGYTFEVYDGRTYKGQVRVEYVHQNVCSALVLRAVDGQVIRQGDAASTRL
ncbi:MAG: hypothetical protein ACKVXR_08805 [Planctomycetota bacterium]